MAALVAVAFLGACGVDRDPARTAVLDGFGTSATERGVPNHRADLDAQAESAGRAIVARGRQELSLLVTIDQAPRRLVASAASGAPSIDALQPPFGDELAADLARAQREAIAANQLTPQPGVEPAVRIQALHRHPGEPVVAVVCLTLDRVAVQGDDGGRPSTAIVAQQVMVLRPSTPSERGRSGWTVIEFDVVWASSTDRTCPSAPSEEELCDCHDEGGPPEDQGRAAATTR